MHCHNPPRPCPAACQANYGKAEPAAVASVKGVYGALGLEALFRAYEQESYDHLVATIDGQADLPAEVFTMLLKKIYKRQK